MAESDPHIRFHDLRRAQAGQRWAMIVLALGAAIELIVFGFISYSTVQHNVRPTAVRAAMAPKVEQMSLPVQKEAIDVLRAVGPKYQRLAAAEFEQIAPDLEKRLVEEGRNLAPALHRGLQSQIESMLDRLRKKVRKDVVARFPSLGEERRLRELVHHFRDRVDRESRAVAGRLRTMFEEELMRVYRVLEELELPDPGRLDHRVLQKRAVHDAVMLLDAELMRLFEEEPDAANDDGNA